MTTRQQHVANHYPTLSQELLAIWEHCSIKRVYSVLEPRYIVQEYVLFNDQLSGVIYTCTCYKKREEKQTLKKTLQPSEIRKNLTFSHNLSEINNLFYVFTRCVRNWYFEVNGQTVATKCTKP